MTMPYKKTVSLFACLLSLTGSYGCQSAQQKVYQQAARPSAEYQSAPYSQMESEHQSPGHYFNEPAPAPVDNNFPPAAPPSLNLPVPEKQTNNGGPLIQRTSQEEVVDDQEYFKSVFSAEPVEPAQKHLGLVPRYSTVSSSVSKKVKQMNGKVKGLYSKMKSHVKTPEWIRKVSGSQVVVQEEEVFCTDMSCVETAPVFEEFPAQAEPVNPDPIGPQPVLPQPKQLQPVFPQPEPQKENNLPRLPPPGETTHWDNNWRVSATLEQLPVDDYSTLDDQLEQWPHSKQRMQSNAQAFQLKKTVPVSTPQFMPNEPVQKHPSQLTVPAMISQEQSGPIRKIGLQNSQNANGPATYSPYTPLPAKATSLKNN
ncbi:hypothetical protein Pan241w_39000 [Gimesia alba]|uniref:Uncharacterized protein n=1 Tax=Gimesia alba TaxID=2527973 RepID=A0A517RIU3_9PLAN|nr:hypothetical protein [Gimesia alba]QDT43796.1 hypothetical protein Pan241w_39000 [Gimesia alba]